MTTAIRWCLAGVRGVRFEALKVGGAWRTSRAAIRRFLAASQPRQETATPVMTDEAAERVLAAFGLRRRGDDEARGDADADVEEGVASRR